MSKENHGRVVEIEDATQYHRTLSSSGSTLIVVDWFATWCSPCKGIAPLYARLSEKHQDVVFLKVDVEKNKTLSTSAAITSLPTFHLIKNGQRVAEIKGANITKLEELILLHKADAQTEEKGDDPIKFPAGFEDISALVDKNQAQCLNQSTDHPWINVLSKDSKHLESDCDAQLLLFVPFSQPVKLHSLNFVAPAKQGPAKVKLFLNQPHLDFNSTDDLEPTQVLDLSEADLNESALVPLKYVKFQNVSSLSLFVASNQTGDEEEITILERLRFIGTSIGMSDMKSFQRVSGEKGEVHG